LGYPSALDSNRPLSILDILLRINASRDPSRATKKMANDLDLWLNKNPVYKEYVNAVTEENKRPFESFFHNRGLIYDPYQKKWVEEENYIRRNTSLVRVALAEFALHYGRLVHQPNEFDPYYLQQSSEVVNYRLQAATNALNLDIQELFVEPTLVRIRKIVRRYNDVEYAQVGKTSVASLSGIQTEVTSGSVSAFDVTPPLRLSELLTNATNLSQQSSTFVPKVPQTGEKVATEMLVGSLPIAQVIGLLAAFEKERAVWRELKTGVNFTIIPNILRNMASAELGIELAISDPAESGNNTSQDSKIAPLSRISTHKVKTSINVNALDFFDLSTFANEATISGGRGYVPIVGTIWRSLFGDIPVIGNLFSWKKGNQTVYHQSLILTNSSITPTAMGIAILYPTEFTDKNGNNCPYTDRIFQEQLTEVNKYKEQQKKYINTLAYRDSSGGYPYTKVVKNTRKIEGED
jgi:hypothetical protein